MGELKQHQPSMSVDKQVENLKTLGLIINDEEYAKRILNDISYFRLIKAYSLGFKPKNGERFGFMNYGYLWYKPYDDKEVYAAIGDSGIIIYINKDVNVSVGITGTSSQGFSTESILLSEKYCR